MNPIAAFTIVIAIFTCPIAAFANPIAVFAIASANVVHPKTPIDIYL
jgi:hypothetical protein